MPKNGPIIIVEDDSDDCMFIEKGIREAGFNNKIEFYENGKAALDYLYLTKEKPFIIICDLNMPVMNGLELLARINGDDFLRLKSIPFVFLTTSDSKSEVSKAYTLAIQGFFKKPETQRTLTEMLEQMLNYWHKCLHPNSD